MQAPIPRSLSRQMRGVPSTRQHGVVLIVALVMLVIIGLSSAAVMRNALSADVVTNNTRSEALATEAAQIALKHCENAILTTGGGVTIQTESTPARWTVFRNWHDTTAIATRLTANQVRAANAAMTLTTEQRPQCLAEATGISGPSGTQAVIVTARGFSPDYTQTTNGRQVSGAVVWLQSTLSLQ